MTSDQLRATTIACLIIGPALTAQTVYGLLTDPDIPQDGPEHAGYVVGSLVIPVSIFIGGIVAWVKLKNKE